MTTAREGGRAGFAGCVGFAPAVLSSILVHCLLNMKAGSPLEMLHTYVCVCVCDRAQDRLLDTAQYQ